MRCSSIGEPLFQPCTVPQRTEAADKAAPCDSPCCSASWCFFLVPIPLQVLLCAGQGGQAGTGLRCGTDPLSTQLHWAQMRWASGIFFFLYWKGKADTIITAFALAMHSNLFPFWLFNTVDRWCLKCGIAHNFSSTLWIAQSLFFFPLCKQFWLQKCQNPQ